MRTIEDFVTESIILRDRSRQDVRSIALATRWASQMDEVLATYDMLVAPVEQSNAA
jgi:hypothetical protein